MDKINVLEGQIKIYEEQAQEASMIAETRKIELEETVLKLKNLESIVEELQTRSGHFERESGGLAEANLKLTQDLATYETKLSDLQANFSATLVEKDETIEQINASKKDLEQQLTSEIQGLQSQISSVMEENNLLNETYQNAKTELQSLISQLEGQLQQQKAIEVTLKSEIESLKSEAAGKLELENRLREVEKQLVTVETQLKEEVENVKAGAAGREAELNLKLEDHAHKVSDRDVLKEQVLQLQRELQLAQTTVAEQLRTKKLETLDKQVKELEQKLEAKLKGEVDSPTELKEVTEVRSRDIGSTLSTPTKRKSKKKLEAAAAAAQTSSSSLETHTHGHDVSAATKIKFIIGVALVSVIIGAILGKRY
ncbi:hypothetical protein Patl1_33228 [Pistacia atlantica]|uniref:Uncharacterized protein n=1 Tax=Pistacia atlantica TaxID=434234 RepID=A0ACC1AM96_9ROSI|nr:hypothetical protein Patl1_33228 [Pistacia atlantica]